MFTLSHYVIYQGLYDDIESDSSQVTEKGKKKNSVPAKCRHPLIILLFSAAKIDYLEKIIKLVGMHLNTLVEARSSKIVAGLEPENTSR